ncbi:MAG: flagellar type III secretion system pore protein FliP [Lachnospiraceae bacterium]|nr:flagellar type III secretion system pore protein FliP [Lachnospiraceae bacterium]
MNGTRRKRSLLRLFVYALLPFVLLYFAPLQARAADADNDGDTDERTYEDDPGSGEDPQDIDNPNVGNTVTIALNDGNGSINGALQIVLILTGMALLPFLLLTLTSFTRIIIVLHFTRQALNTQTAPPNMVLLGIALFLTVYIMSPVFSTIYTDAIEPLNNGDITTEEALEAGIAPLREYMYPQTEVKDVSVFMEIAGYEEWSGAPDDVPLQVLIPAYVMSELRTAFIIGFLIYIPFLIIDMVVASVLMSMGMMMLPPTTISMPFKILLFVLADGWNLIIVNLVKTFF